MKSFLTVIVLSLAFFSCKKDKGISKTTLLTQKKWYPTRVQIKTFPYHIWESDVPLEPCKLDNALTFGTDGSYSVEDGPTTCIYANPISIENGTWSFTNNESHMALVINNSGTNVTEDCTIEQLDENTLIYNFYSYTAIIYYRYTLSH